ncbi:endolytic transglycosylase MltG [Litorimonas sp. RW-G-Af-16]|uniref:endolytic transglycosylase MltG n=1 Tax=Litorimonas sp. RW-G-Af-16 TaxID=3241168 RepID=UPI00390CB0ED
MSAPPKTSPTFTKPQKRWLGIIGLAAILTFFGALLLATYAAVNYKYERAQRSDAAPMVFTVPKGAGLSSIATRLEQNELIDSAFVFKLVTKLRGNEANFKAGEFLVDPKLSMAGVYDALANGKAVLYPFTAPEGLTSAMIVRSLDGVPTLIDDDPAVPPEGTLLPETYLTPRGMKQSELLQKMALAQKQLLDDLWDNRAPNLPIKTRAEAIILASVVEKETGVGMERGKVAGVFTNRLRIGMRLQSDPTIIYGVSRGEILLNKAGKRRGIYRSEIDRKTDWNTYQIDGLPKTAICNPGADAIRAVLNPDETDALFFVADGTGGHAFAKTLAEHERNVAKWRKIERERRQR